MSSSDLPSKGDCDNLRTGLNKRGLLHSEQRGYDTAYPAHSAIYKDELDNLHRGSDVMQHGKMENQGFANQSFLSGSYTLLQEHEQNCRAVDKDFDTVEKRLKSYANFPPNAQAEPKELSENGLYYVGIADKVKCAYCRGMLYNWEKGDSPLEEHHRHFPECPFIKLRYKRLKQTPQVIYTAPSVVINNPPQTLPQNKKLSLMVNEILSQKTTSSAETKCEKSKVIGIVKGMGYDDDIINKAYGILCNKGEKDIKSAAVLDIIFELEENPNKYSDSVACAAGSITGMEKVSSASAKISESDNKISSQPTFSASQGVVISQQSRQQPQFASASLSQCPPPFSSNQPLGQLASGNRSRVSNNQAFAQNEVQHQNSSFVKPASSCNFSSMVQSKSIAPNPVTEKPQSSQNNGTSIPKNHTATVVSKSCDGNTNIIETDSSSHKSDTLAPKSAPADPVRVKQLKDEQIKLKQNVVCNVCRQNKINTLFLPCRHLVACEECSADMNDCARCSKKIIGTVKIFMP